MCPSAFVVFAVALAAWSNPPSAVDGLSPTAATIVVPSLLRAVLAAADRTVDVPLEAGGWPITLRIAPHSFRADDFRALAPNDLGALVEVEVPAPRTFIGAIVESPGTTVRAAAVDGGLTATFSIGGKRWFVQPVDDAGTHAVFTHDDIEPAEVRCAVGDEARPGSAPEGGIAGLNCHWLTEIACDADFEFYVSNGSSVPNTVADIENVLNGVIGIFNADCDIDFVLTEIVVRSSPNDPYTTSVPENLLLQFADEWFMDQESIERDLAHLFTGKNLSGDVVGQAWIGSLCLPQFAYSLAQSKWSAVYANRVWVTAHYLGHNFGAEHCNGQPDCGVMCAAVGECAGPITVFGPTSAGVIASYADNFPCLGPKGPSEVDASDGTTCSAITVLFSEVEGAGTYTVYRAVDSGIPTDAVVVQSDATSPYIDTNIMLATQYGYWVTATNAEGCESNLGAVDFGSAPILGGAPTFVAATDATHCDKVVVVWNTVPFASGYEIWRGTLADSAQATFLADDNASPYQDVSAVVGQVYFYWVRTANACGEPGYFSLGDSGSRKAPPPAGAPNASDDDCPDVTVTWPIVRGATSSSLWRGTTSDPATATLLVANANSPVVDDSVAAGMTYWYFVQSFNSCGGGSLGAGDHGAASGGAADLDGDCAVDGADLGLLLGNWGGAGTGDLDGNGTVDGADLGLLLGSWM